MTVQDSSFIGSIPEVYDFYLVPLIFESYAADIADRVSVLSPANVLETAAGSGVVTRALAAALPTNATIMATDLNQPMLDHAQRQQESDPRVMWRVADALDLPFDSDSFDVVVCQFGVMFFPDRVAAYREALRVVKPGGTFLFSVWDDIRKNEFADVVTDAMATAFPNDPPKFLARTPHGYNNEQLIERELVEAGFANVGFTSVEETSSATSPRHPAIAYCQGTPLRNEIETRDPDRLDEATEIAARAIADKYGSAGVSAKVQGIVVTAAK